VFPSEFGNRLAGPKIGSGTVRSELSTVGTGVGSSVEFTVFA